MIFIAHRGNINGPSVLENSMEHIESALNMGYDVEIDIHVFESTIYLGHDVPTQQIDLKWLERRKKNLWIHCKNTYAMVYLQNSDFNYFWHQNDTMTLTSHRYLWVYPGKQPIANSIAVMPELNNELVHQCYGICSDYIERYRNEGFSNRR